MVLFISTTVRTSNPIKCKEKILIRRSFGSFEVGLVVGGTFVCVMATPLIFICKHHKQDATLYQAGKLLTCVREVSSNFDRGTVYPKVFAVFYAALANAMSRARQDDVLIPSSLTAACKVCPHIRRGTINKTHLYRIGLHPLYAGGRAADQTPFFSGNHVKKHFIKQSFAVSTIT
jgi:hypothetical protein